MGRPTGSTNTKPRVVKKPPAKVICSCCAGDITGFAAYDDPPEGLLCYICASIISRVRKGELDLDDKKERLKFAAGRFDIVRSYLRLHEDKVTETRMSLFSTEI